MNLTYVKTVLRVLKNLENIVSQLDELIFEKALCTNMRLSDCAYNSAQKQVERVLALINKKNNLINLKLIADEVFENIDPHLSLLLKLRFVDKKPHDEIVKQLDVSERTYFRHLEKACVSFGKQLLVSGGDEDWFKQNYFDQPWIRKLFERIENGSRPASDEN